MARTVEERIRDRLFPGEVTFDRRRGGFAALPIILRLAQHLFNPREWQVYTYLLMRAGPAGVAWLNPPELAHDLDFRSLPKLKVYLKTLEAAGWIRNATASGKEYYLIRDPYAVLKEQAGRMGPERLGPIEDLEHALLERKKPAEKRTPAEKLGP